MCRDRHAREGAQLTRCNVAIQVGDNTLRKVVGFYLALGRQPRDFRNQTPVAPDSPLQQSFVAKRIETWSLPSPWPAANTKGEIARLAGFQKPLFQTLQ